MVLDLILPARTTRGVCKAFPPTRNSCGSPPCCACRYPSLHGFLLTQLQEAAQQLQPAGGAASSHQAVHPSLFPVLVILSRLRPALVLDTNSSRPERGAISPAAFVPIVQQCAAAAAYTVRQLAATALVPLIPAVELGARCEEVARQLPPAGQPILCHNALHGRLLLLQALLQAPCSDASDAGSGGSGPVGGSAVGAPALAARLAPLLQPSLWLASPECSCAPIRLAYLCALQPLLAAAAAATPDSASGSGSGDGASPWAAARQLGAALDGVLEASFAASQQLPATDADSPGGSGWLKRCASLYLGPLLQLHAASASRQPDSQQLPSSCPARSSPSAQLLAHLLSRLQRVADVASYDARAAAYAAAAGQLGSLARGQGGADVVQALQRLQEHLEASVGGETHPKAQLRLLELVTAVQQQQQQQHVTREARADSRAAAAAHAAELLGVRDPGAVVALPSPAARSAALLWLAHSMRAPAARRLGAGSSAAPTEPTTSGGGGDAAAGGAGQLVGTCLGVISEFSEPWQTEGMRMAAGGPWHVRMCPGGGGCLRRFDCWAN